MVGAALDRSEPSLRFAYDGIHTKSGAKNLQGNDLGKGLGGSQVPIQRGSQNPGLSKSLEHFLEIREKTTFSHEPLKSQKSHHPFMVSITLLL